MFAWTVREIPIKNPLVREDKMRTLIVLMVFLTTQAFAQQTSDIEIQNVFADMQAVAIAQKHSNDSNVALVKAFQALKDENVKLKSEMEKLKAGLPKEEKK